MAKNEETDVKGNGTIAGRIVAVKVDDLSDALRQEIKGRGVSGPYVYCAVGEVRGKRRMVELRPGEDDDAFSIFAPDMKAIRELFGHLRIESDGCSFEFTPRDGGEFEVSRRDMFRKPAVDSVREMGWASTFPFVRSDTHLALLRSIRDAIVADGDLRGYVRKVIESADFAPLTEIATGFCKASTASRLAAANGKLAQQQAWDVGDQKLVAGAGLAYLETCMDKGLPLGDCLRAMEMAGAPRSDLNLAHEQLRETPAFRRKLEQFAAQTQDRIDGLIARGVWLVTAVGPTQFSEEPRHSFAYTTGLKELFGHPELFICGLPSRSAVHILNAAGEAVRGGAVFGEGAEADRILSDFKAVFRGIPHVRVVGEAGECVKRYGPDGFEAVQLFWPDKDGKFPWEDGCNPDNARRQIDPFGVGATPPQPSAASPRILH